MRTLKDPEVRRAEIMDTAERLFSIKGYNQTTIMDILNEIGVAKGTFYYYFKSKEEVLDAIIERIVDEDVAKAEKIVNDPNISPFDKLFQVLLKQQPENGEGKERMMQQIHHPSNAEMHQKTLVQSTKRLTPLLASIVEQGIREGVMYTQYPQETMEFLVVSGQTIFDEGLFQWQPDAALKRARAFIQLMEIALGAKKGSFEYMLEILTGKADIK